MKILATISDMKRLALVIDLQTGDIEATIPVQAEFFDITIQNRPHCRPFGITWNGDELFISNNRQLLVYDRKLAFQRIASTRLQVNTHQLAYGNGRVWAANPWTDSLIGVPTDPRDTALEFDLMTQTLRDYNGVDVTSRDIHHFNSVLWVDGQFFAGAHGLGKDSFINQHDAETFTLVGVRHGVGNFIHGLARQDGVLFWLNTESGEIRSDYGFCLPLTRWGFARGFALTRDYFVVGISEFLGRSDRYGGDSWVQVIDRSDGELVSEIRLRDSGGLNDLRLLDEYDFAHCRTPLWP
jgi:hypothetical protein